MLWGGSGVRGGACQGHGGGKGGEVILMGQGHGHCGWIKFSNGDVEVSRSFEGSR